MLLLTNFEPSVCHDISSHSGTYRRVSPNTSARNTIDRYHQQPRSIIDYEPGTSSLAERDKSVKKNFHSESERE